MSWNGFPRRVRSSILSRLSTNSSPKPDDKPVDDDTKTIWIRLPYMGKQGESITNKLLRNLKRCFKTAVQFKVSYNVQKISTFCPTKDRIPSYQTANVIYNTNCPGCGEDYIGKSERCFGIRMECHGKRDNEPMHNHLRNCNQFQELYNFFVRR